MDLTFVEQEPYFPPTTLPLTSPDLPVLFPSIPTSQQPPSPPHHESSHLPTPPPDSSHLTTPNPTTSGKSTQVPPPQETLTTNIPPLKTVYNRRRKILESILQSTTCQELDMDSVANIETPPVPSKHSSPNLDAFPIAIRKGVRECTKHPIKKFVGYGSLMTSFQAFTATLDAHQIPKNIDEASRDLRWKCWDMIRKNKSQQNNN
ncbi:hypothetical protein V6N13_109612 [Hibiscus sabdariffa]|uniref:Uncharacterized protein n=1 Tax=Hibiscus sabdariffa TaxID=183260 RepID=A0ABR2FQT5_9ROSI